MKHRKLRIAWSVAWGVVAVLLVGLWVRSYWYLDQLTLPINRGASITVGDVQGVLIIGFMSFPAKWEVNQMSTSRWVATDSSAAERPSRFWGGIRHQKINMSAFGRTNETLTKIYVPLWTLTILFCVLSLIAWASFWSNRFTLRTLLIATTLVAILLGLIVCLTS